MGKVVVRSGFGKVFGWFLLVVAVLGIFGLLFILMRHDARLAEENADRIESLEGQVQNLSAEVDELKGEKEEGGVGLFGFLFFIGLAVVLAVVLYRYVPRWRSGVAKLQRKKLEKLLFDKLRCEEPGIWGVLEDHKVESDVGYYAAKPKFKQLVVCFCSVAKTRLAPLCGLPPRYSLFCYATSFKSPEEDVRGPFKCGVGDAMELLRLSQYGHKGGGLPREPVKAESVLPPAVEEAVYKRMTGELLEG